MNTYFEEALTVVQSEQFANEFKSTIKFILRIVNLLLLVIAGLFTLVKVFVCRQLGSKEQLSVYNDGSNDGVIKESSNVEFTNESSNDGSNVEFTIRDRNVEFTNEEVINEGSNDWLNDWLINEEVIDKVIINEEVIDESTHILTLENQTEEMSTEEVIANEIINEEAITEEVITEAFNVETDNTYSILKNQTEEVSTENNVYFEDLSSQSAEVINNDKSESDKSARHKELKQMKATELRQLCGSYSIEYKNKEQAATVILEVEFPNVVIPF